MCQLGILTLLNIAKATKAKQPNNLVDTADQTQELTHENKKHHYIFQKH